MAIVEIKEHKFHMDGYIKANLDAVKKNVTKQNYDAFILVCGREGFGKSTLAMQYALYCDPNFTLDNVVFTADQFLEAVETAPKYSAIVFDETMGYLSSRGAMSKFNKTLIKVMSEMRSKNLFVFLCIPSFFMMDWYPAFHRCTGVLYVKKRGMVCSYDYPTKKKLYMQGKKSHEYIVPPNFYARFVKYFPLDKEAYEKKKQEAINEWASTTRLESNFKTGRDALISECLNKNLMRAEEVAKLTKLGVRSVNLLAKKSRDKEAQNT